MTSEEQQQAAALAFNQAEEHGWKSNDGNWSICSYHWGDQRFFQICRRVDPRPDPTQPRWVSVRAGIDTLDTAAAIANEMARN